MKCCICNKPTKQIIYYSKYYRDFNKSTFEYPESLCKACFSMSDEDYDNRRKNDLYLPYAMLECRGGCEHYGLVEIKDIKNMEKEMADMGLVKVEDL